MILRQSIMVHALILSMICSRNLVSSCNNHASTHELLVLSFIAHAIVPSCFKSWFHLAFITIHIFNSFSSRQRFNLALSMLQTSCSISWIYFLLIMLLALNSFWSRHRFLLALILDLSCINYASYSDFILLQVLIITNGSYPGFMLLLVLASFGIIHF